MNLKMDYKKLYEHWRNEFQQPELTHLSQETLNEYKKNIEIINDLKDSNTKDKVEKAVIKSFQENFNYLLSDFLKMREIKIKNRALALQEINFKDLIQAEKLLFQNLISAIKGYEKVKNLSDIVEPEPFIAEQTLKLKKELDEEKVGESSEIVEGNAKITENYNYTLIRFLKETPALVGIDLINYGPFNKEDVAIIPFKNAKILISEKF